MDTRDDTASEPAAPAVARRDGPDWGHLPHGNLTNQIIGAGFEAHNVLGAGFLEAVYANALTVELRHRGRVAASGPTGNKGRAEKRRRQNNGKT